MEPTNTHFSGAEGQRVDEFFEQFAAIVTEKGLSPEKEVSMLPAFLDGNALLFFREIKQRCRNIQEVKEEFIKEFGETDYSEVFYNTMQRGKTLIQYFYVLSEIAARANITDEKIFIIKYLKGLNPFFKNKLVTSYFPSKAALRDTLQQIEKVGLLNEENMVDRQYETNKQYGEREWRNTIPLSPLRTNLPSEYRPRLSKGYPQHHFKYSRPWRNNLLYDWRKTEDDMREEYQPPLQTSINETHRKDAEQYNQITLNNPDKELPYSCLYCHRKFARPHEKVKHERIHTGEKPHSCEICGKSFRVSYCLTLHMRTHTGARPYACPHCPKRFKAHSVYNHHLLTHSEVRAYKCPFCPKAFKTLVQLAGHKNSHTKPFSCQQCNRPFASLYAVRVHTETHNKQNNLKFSCEHCGASYARVSALKDHIKSSHNMFETETTEEILELPTSTASSSIPLSEEVSTQVQNKNYEIDMTELASNELIV